MIWECRTNYNLNQPRYTSGLKIMKSWKTMKSMKSRNLEYLPKLDNSKIKKSRAM